MRDPTARSNGVAIHLTSEVLVGEPVGVAETENGDWIVRFFDYDLGVIDRRTGNFGDLYT